MAENSKPLPQPRRPDPHLPWNIRKLFLWIEFCIVWLNYSLHERAIFQVIENLGKLTFLFSIIAAAASYVLEAPDRAAERENRIKQLQLQAYSVLATSTNGQAPVARANAFDLLHEAKLPLIALNLSFVDLTKHKLANTDLRSCTLNDAVLGANLQGVILSNSELYRAQFEKPVNLSDAHLERCRLGGAQLEGAILDGANLTRAHLEQDPDSQQGRYGAAIIKNASMVKATLALADCSYVVFDGVDVSGADFTDALLYRADLSSVKNLKNASMVKAILRESNCRGVVFEGVNISEADFTDAVLDGADLSGADLSSVKRLKNASMVNAILTKADCTGVVFEGVNVSEADFTDAVLDGADLRSAKKLTQAQVESASSIQDTLLPDHINREAAEEAIKQRLAP